jgi:excisionase family DNA binding protein
MAKKSQNADRPVWTPTEVAGLLGISVCTAYEAIKKGDIPSMKIGRRWFVPKASFDKMLGK